MANWEKLIEEHYEKKNKIDFKDFYRLIDEALERETNYQGSGAIEGHPHKRLSTKGKKKLGGDPFDQDPPKARSKSAPAGFGVLEEEDLEEATIRDTRTFYYVSPKNLTSSMWSKIKTEAEQDGVELSDDKMAFEDRIFAVQLKQGETYYFEMYLLPEPVKSSYGLRGLVMQSNAKKSAVSEMSDGQKIFTYDRVNVNPGSTKITWLQTKPEELRAENEHLMMIKQKFIDNGIGDDPDEGLFPATITVMPTHGGNPKKFENIVRIDKMASKTAVGDFALYRKDDDNPVFSMSHKAIGFERYAALKSTLKKIQSQDEGGGKEVVNFLNKVAQKWTEGALTGNRSTTGYYQPVTDDKFQQEVIYLIYGIDSTAKDGTVRKDSADSLLVGEITLNKKGDREFVLSVTGGGKKGNSECLIKPTLPADADYTPILKSRQGGNGSWVVLGDYGDNREANKNDVLTKLTNMVNSGERTIEDFKKMSYVIDHEVDEVTGAVSITSAKLSVRYYISPARRTDGAEDISQES